MPDEASGALVKTPTEFTEVERRYLPVMSLAVAKHRREMMISAIGELMVEAKEANNFEGDYGVLPGTKQKTLLQPGADKLNNLFGLVPRFEIVKEVLDWSGDQHDGEPFFFYEVRASLWRGDPNNGGYLMGEGLGSANSWESKYRYRKAQRVCPSCNQDAIMKSKFAKDGEPPGWYCNTNKGGCGMNFRMDDAAITEQETGNVANEFIYDLVNTILKMACKRAKISGTINATSAHEFFTPDLDDAKILPSQQKPGAETFEQMRERRVREAQEARAAMGRTGNASSTPSAPTAAVAAEPPQPSPEVVKMWARMKSTPTIEDVMYELLDTCKLKMGDKDGGEFFKVVLKEFGASEPKDFRKFEAARQCARALYERLKQLPDLDAAGQTVEGKFVASDEDIPAELQVPLPV